MCNKLTSIRILFDNEGTCGRHDLGFVAEEDAECTNGPEDGCSCPIHVRMLAVMD